MNAITISGRQSALSERFRLFSFSFVTLASLVASMPHQSLGATISGDEIIEAMMENQGADAAYLGRQYGGDASSLIQFQSSIDPVAGTFTYSTAPGATYQGLGLSMTSTGVYDSSTASWSLETIGSLGGSSWVQDGSGAYTGDLFNPAIGMSAAAGAADPSESGIFGWKIPIGGGHYLDFHSTPSVVAPPGSSTLVQSFATFSFTIDGKVVKSITLPTGKDDITKPLPFSGKGWRDEIDVYPGVDNIASFIVASQGSTPTDGGLGSFTMQITPAPEPASLGLIAVGLLLLSRFKVLKAKAGRAP